MAPTRPDPHPWWPAAGPAAPLRTDRWLEAALYDPGHGYYRAGRREPGAGGDFHTPVHLGGALGGLLGRWAQARGVPAIVEIGGADGRLANDITACHQVPYRLVDWGAGDGERWRRCPPEAPGPPVPGALLLGVEVLDALPVRRFRPAGEGWEEEHWLADEEGAWTAAWLPAPAAPVAALPAAERTGGVVEWRPGLAAALASWAALAPGGEALLIDYGRLEPPGDTLRGFAGHRLLEPLCLPGRADWTATVDFTRAARLARESGWGGVAARTLTNFVLEAGDGVVFGEGLPPRERLGLKELASPLGLGETFMALSARLPGQAQP